MIVSTTLHAHEFTSQPDKQWNFRQGMHLITGGRRHASYNPPAQYDRHQHGAQHEQACAHQNAAHLHGRDVEVSKPGWPALDSTPSFEVRF